MNPKIALLGQLKEFVQSGIRTKGGRGPEKMCVKKATKNGESSVG